jgi:hypothetical protein
MKTVGRCLGGRIAPALLGLEVDHAALVARLCLAQKRFNCLLVVSVCGAEVIKSEIFKIVAAVKRRLHRKLDTAKSSEHGTADERDLAQK